ncbi:MAG: undecaprenyl-diphosphate phosphatase [Clostridia bacterium]|nr:undecaprenyl-diphosphate phosphatase [Clostridia bacterium]
MTNLITALIAAVYGIVEGITEWLPVSSTGHLILLESFLKMPASAEFMEMFDVVIQLGACLAVLSLYFKTLVPTLAAKKEDGGFFGCSENKKTFTLWLKIIVAVLPSAVIGLLLDDWFDAHFYNAATVTVTLALYGVLFILVEQFNKKRTPSIESLENISFGKALGMGCFQVLALIPGTSRSGSTILGGLLLGYDRKTAAEFSFFLSLPTMVGASALKILKFLLDGMKITAAEIVALAVGCIVAYLVSVIAIKFLMEFVKRHSFSAFGIYRIALAAVMAVLLAAGIA